MSSRSVLTGGDQRAAASSSSALYSKPWRSRLFPWIGFFTPKPSENETTFCWGHLSEADTPLLRFYRAVCFWLRLACGHYKRWERAHERPKTERNRGSGDRLSFSIMHSARNHRGGGSGPSICHARHSGPIPEGNGKDGEAHLLFVWELLPADSERGSPLH